MAFIKPPPVQDLELEMQHRLETLSTMLKDTITSIVALRTARNRKRLEECGHE